MIANADKFTYCGYVITQTHVTYLFKEGMLIEKLVDQPCQPPGAIKPKPMPIGKDMLGWHALGTSDRWGSMDFKTWLMRTGSSEDWRQLRADWVAHKIPEASSRAMFVVAHHIAGAPVLQCWNGDMVAADPRHPDGPFGRTQAIERLRWSHPAAVTDTALMGSWTARSQAWRRLESPAVSAVLFSTGLYISRHPDVARQGFHPLASLYTHLNDEGATALRNNPKLVNEMDTSGVFMGGRYDAPEGTGHCAWFGVNESGEIVDHEVFDAPMLSLDDPKLHPPLTQDAAVQLLQAGNYAHRWHPLRIDHVDELGGPGEWGSCGFVAGIQAAFHRLGRADLVKPDAHSTLAPVIESFLQAHPDRTPKSLRKYGKVMPEDFVQMVRNDQGMRCQCLSVGMDLEAMALLIDWIGFKQISCNLNGLALTADNLPRANAIYVVERPGREAHAVYVTPAGEHLLWGTRAGRDAAALELAEAYSNIAAVYQLG